MSALSQFPFSGLALLRRMPFWAQAAAACALFAGVGVAIMDDYGIGADEIHQRRTAAAIADYALGVSEEPPSLIYRYSGVAFETPLMLLERALHLQDTRHIHLIRRLLSHLFFIAGGFACAMLAYRMLGSRWAALFAMLLFLLHPRLYAHSFFNTKDIPFAVALVIALFLAHRAFRRDTLGAFLLCGIGVGLAINLRPFGTMLPPLILAMRAPDLWQAGDAERKRILISAALFVAAALATAYIIHPYYWENPLRFVEGARVLSQYPVVVTNLFMGELYKSNEVPWNFTSVWFTITSPPVALPLGALGAASVCWQTITRPLRALSDRETRFRILLLSCIVTPVAVAIILQANLYNDWRHMYFLWGPFCLLAAVGLHALANSNMGKGVWKVGARLPGWVRGGGARRGLAYGVVGAGLITTLTAMAALHPNQQVYFNALTDTKTPGVLGERYDMDYFQVAQLQLLERLLARYPDGALRVWMKNSQDQILRQKDRNRVIDFQNPHAADFFMMRVRGDLPLRKDTRQTSLYIPPSLATRSVLERRPVHSIRAYGSVIAFLFARDVDAYRAAYEDVAANGTLLARSDFDIYVYDGALYYLGANCEPPMSSDAAFWVFLHIIPDDPADLPADMRERGFDNLDFRLDRNAAFFDGKCIDSRRLPDYPIARIKTGQNARAPGGAEWRVDVNLATRATAQALHDSIAAGEYGRPVAQSDFDVYMNRGGLAYLKENCAAGDADAHFFLHIFPADSANLPAARRESGFANLDFQFADHGARIGDKCVTTRELPTYPIDRIRTGQFVSGEGSLWRVEFPVSR